MTNTPSKPSGQGERSDEEIRQATLARWGEAMNEMAKALIVMRVQHAEFFLLEDEEKVGFAFVMNEGDEPSLLERAWTDFDWSSWEGLLE